MTSPAYQVFISHAGSDVWVAKQIQTHLTAAGAATFLDEGDIYVGDDFDNVLLSAIRKSHEVLVLCTPWAMTRQYIWLETGAAWALGLRVIFVLHGISEADLSQRPGNPALLKRTNIVQLTDIDKYFQQLKSRIAGLNGSNG